MITGFTTSGLPIEIIGGAGVILVIANRQRCMGGWEVQFYLLRQVLMYPLCTSIRPTNAHFQVESVHSGARHSRLDLMWRGHFRNVRPLDGTAPANAVIFIVYCFD